MKKAIIHISDLHVLSSLNDDNLPEEKLNSWLNCKNSDETDRFINSFTDSVRKDYNNYELYLVITGDLTNTAKEDEFKELLRILNKIIQILKISKNNILIIPGDHDVNRFEAKKASELDSNSKPVYEFLNEKFGFFAQFYNTFFNEIKQDFCAEKAIVDTLIFDKEKIIYIGFNSNFKIGAMSNPGFIPVDILENELSVIEKQYGDYNKIALFHHNFLAFYIKENDGQWDKENAIDVKRILESKNFKCYIYGNEHTPYSSLDAGISNISIGSLSKETHCSYNVLVIEEHNDSSGIELLNNFYCTSNFNIKGKPNFGEWSPNINKGDVDSVKLINPLKEDQFQEASETPSTDNSKEQNTENLQPVTTNVCLPYGYVMFSESNDDHKTLLNLVKSKQLFHSGHFHWSKTSRAHNWIDVSKLLSDKDILLNTKNLIINLIKENKLEFDFIIGLGIEGNMLATRTSIIYDTDYTFLPYSYRYEDHSRYEKELNFNCDSKYKTVLIITDVVHDGRTIRKLIHKEGRAKEFFKDVEKIIVIALFYTGSLVKENRNDFDLLNKYDEDKNFDRENDHLEKRIQFHFVSHMKVEECPYNKDNFETDCIIVREKLGCIHKFYSGN